MSAPPPPQPSTATATGTATGQDWRKSITQMYRTSEVRAIAPILASLEPGATSDSKKMLAMKFEDTIFQSAKSFEDYKKTIQKRLTKLKKHYAKMQQQQQQQGGVGAGGVGSAADDAAATTLLREREILLERELTETYGAQILYIVKHADLAVELMRERHGDSRANILKQHADNAKSWALCLGLLPSEAGGGAVAGHRDMAYLTKLKGQLESRVETIRSHVVKMADPDLFLEETLRKLDEELVRVRPSASSMLRSSLLRFDPDHRRQLLLLQRQRQQQQQQQQQSQSQHQPQQQQQQQSQSQSQYQPQPRQPFDFAVDRMKQLLERTNAPVPIPRRNHRDADRIRAAVVRIDKVRAAVQAFSAYMAMSVEEKTADSSFRGCLNHCHKVVMECCDALEEEYAELVREVEGAVEEDDDDDGDGDDGETENETEGGGGRRRRGKRAVLLEDAWNRALVLKEDEDEAEVEADEQVTVPEEVEAKAKVKGKGQEEGKEPDAKRVKLESRVDRATNPPKRPVVIKSRILLTPGRHIFPTLIPQLRRKKAILVKNGAAAYVKLEFGKAFEMRIYFVPLLVTIRAMEVKSSKEEEEVEQPYLPTVSLAGGLRWPSSYQGLGIAPSSDLSSSSAPVNTRKTGNSNSSSSNNNNTISGGVSGSGSGSGGKQQHGNLSVLGATGPAVGHIVAKQLEYASARATHVLRRCFADATTGKGALAKTEYEIELLETGALIRFLQIARNTYNPGWVDVD